MTITDYPDFQTPQAHATQIAGTGVPLLRFTNNLGTAAGVTVAGGVNTALLAFTVINQPGYEVTVQVSMPLGTGTVPFVHVELEWLDTASNIQVAKRDIVVTAGPGTANTLTYYLRGPMHGDQFSVRAINLDPAVTATINWTANQTSHVYENDQAIQFQYHGTPPNGFANPGGVPTANLVAFTEASVAASGANFFLCALYAGDIILNIDNVTGTNAVKVELFDGPGFITGSANSPVFGVIVAAAGSASIQMTLPYSPLTLKVTNQGTAGAITPVVTLMGQQH